MLDEEKNELIIKSEEEKELDTAIDNSVAVLTLDEEQQQLLKQIIAAPTQQELQAQIDLFNLSQAKKDALRVVKLNTLLGKVEDQAIERFTKRPDEVSNKELLEYMTVVSGQIDRSQKYIDAIKEKTVIKATQINKGDTNVNINIGTDLDKEGKEHVIDAIQGLLKQLQNQETPNVQDVIDAAIDVDLSENEENIVYNNESVVNMDEENQGDLND